MSPPSDRRPNCNAWQAARNKVMIAIVEVNFASISPAGAEFCLPPNSPLEAPIIYEHDVCGNWFMDYESGTSLSVQGTA